MSMGSEITISNFSDTNLFTPRTLVKYELKRYVKRFCFYRLIESNLIYSDCKEMLIFL